MKEIHQKILDFVTGYLLECGYPPTNREIADGVGYTSTSIKVEGRKDNGRTGNQRREGNGPDSTKMV